jgi:hypothetical protein
MSHHPRPRRRLCRAGTAVLVVPLLVASVLAVPAPGAAGAEPAPSYRPPVDAPVHDPFRAPDGPYGPGNRGIEYDTGAHVPVRAAADGRVTFAGWVAGSLHVTVLHDDGVRTTASYLAEVTVVVGEEVVQGDVLGTTAGRLHFGARRGDAYFDPATLFQDGPPRVRLVPFDRPPGTGLAGERSAIGQLLGAGGAVLGALGTGVDAAVAVGGAAADVGVEALRLAVHYAPYVHPTVRMGMLVLAGITVTWEAWQRSHRPCTSDDQPVPGTGEGRVALLVAGFGSTSGHTAVDDVDVAALGYDPADVLRFSYEGGRIPDDDVELPGVPVAPYDADASHQDLRRAGARLADLVEDVAAARPGEPIDLLAHSQGGVVARLALIELEERHGVAWLDRVGLLATIGTPHLGADLATAAAGVGLTPGGDVLLDGFDAVTGVGSTARSTGQLAQTSDVIRELGDHPVPEGLRAVSVAARGDLVVPAPRTEAAGLTSAVVPLVGLDAHSRLPGADRTTRELALARAGLPPVCVGFGDALADEAAGAAIGFGETVTGGLLTGVTAALQVVPAP